MLADGAQRAASNELNKVWSSIASPVYARRDQRLMKMSLMCIQ
ncbi:MAG: hypothetical protein WDM70_00730 [Nitrosomonadales bacterium]